MKRKIILAMLMATTITVACAKESADLKTDKQKLSYTVGYQMAQNIKHQGMDLDVDAFAQAIKDVLNNKEPKLTQEQMQQVARTYQEQQQQKRLALAAKNKEAGDKFRAENKKKKGVKELKSGIQYKVIEKGKGKKPKATDTVEVHYRGQLIDGTEFDSSYKRGKPATFPVTGVIKGWQEVLQMMKEGAKWHVVIPAELAYGARGAGPMIGPNSTLIFEINLISIKTKTK